MTAIAHPPQLTRQRIRAIAKAIDSFVPLYDYERPIFPVLRELRSCARKAFADHLKWQRKNGWNVSLTLFGTRHDDLQLWMLHGPLYEVVTEHVKSVRDLRQKQLKPVCFRSFSTGLPDPAYRHWVISNRQPGTFADYSRRRWQRRALIAHRTKGWSMTDNLERQKVSFGRTYRPTTWIAL